MSKKWYESKTVWYNTVMTVVSVASLFGTAGELGLPEWVPMAALTVQGVGNVILRVWFTDTAIS